MSYWYTISQLQQMAAAGRIRPTDRFYDPPVSGPKPAWRRLAVAAGLAALAVASQRTSDANRLRSLPWDDLRRAIFRRDRYTCAYCGHRGNSATLEVDHRLPLSRGGTDDPDNLTTACWECNREKGDMTAFEYRFSRLWR